MLISCIFEDVVSSWTHAIQFNKIHIFNSCGCSLEIRIANKLVEVTVRRQTILCEVKWCLVNFV